jgi:uncharacterized protein (UPF0216 family)
MNDDKTVEDFISEAENETVDNDEDWLDFEQQQLKLLRKELSTQTFWREQTIGMLRNVYKNVFPGITEAEKSTKKAHMEVIAAYLKEDATRIDIQAAIGLESTQAETAAAERRTATRNIFSNSGFTEINQHYLEYAGILDELVDEEDDNDDGD